MSLPVVDVLPQLLEALRERGAAVLLAPPGAGKTTLVPPALLAAEGLLGDDEQIIMLQPRRVAARSAAKFLSRQDGSELGDRYGFAVRFERKGGRHTRCMVVTEGLLTRRLQDDPFLEGVGAVILDEFHERSLHADLALAFLKQVRAEVRPDLKLLVMSATLDPGPVSTFLAAPVIESAGRAYPVQIDYLAHDDPLANRRLEAQVAGSVRRMLPQTAGDILVFLPGAGEIARAEQALREFANSEGLSLCPLHGDLPSDVQDRALRKAKQRKVILSTNIAETSVTIDGVTAVIDSGLQRSMRHDSQLGLDRLELGFISKASADQRAGRAGRQAKGHALRLWSKVKHRDLDEHRTPEIHLVDLAPTVLEIRAWGSDDPLTFDWFEAPTHSALQSADALLIRLGALGTQTHRMTPVGEALRQLPLHPRLGKLLIAGSEFNCLRDAARIAALVSERDVLRTRRSLGSEHALKGSFGTGPSDLLFRLDLIWGSQSTTEIDGRAARRVRQVATQVEQRANRALSATPAAATRQCSSRDSYDECLLKAVLLAWPDRVAKRRDLNSKTASMVGGRQVELSPLSVVTESSLLVAVALSQRGAKRAHARPEIVLASSIEESWLIELFPESMQTEEVCRFDESTGRVVQMRTRRFMDLVLSEVRVNEVDPSKAEAVLSAAVVAHGDRLIREVMTEGLEAWVTRVRCLREWMPELELPDLSHETLLDVLATLVPGCRSFADLKRAPLMQTLQGMMSHRQREALSREAPERIALPQGRSVKVRYALGKTPVIAAKVQHLFTVMQTPRLGGGAVPCVVELLAPNQRPVQITDDLASFWSKTYVQVRKDLRGRYPKHHWPETAPTLESELPPPRPRRRSY